MALDRLIDVEVLMLRMVLIVLSWLKNFISLIASTLFFPPCALSLPTKQARLCADRLNFIPGTGLVVDLD